MRILGLEIEGFGPYRERQTIDFRAFERAGLFAITGRTGAGKSTVLDAVLFALFDAVPRYEGAERSVRSDFARPEDPTRVRLDFEVRGERYRVTRTPAYLRPKRRGTGTTEEKATALLEVWEPRGSVGPGPGPAAEGPVGEGSAGGSIGDGGGRAADRGTWRALDVQPREVGPRVSAILGLDAAQFRQVILLAQARFAEFLHTDTKTRRGVLRTLFDTGRYEHLERTVRDLARAAEREVADVDRALAALLDQAVELAATPELVGAGVGVAGASPDGAGQLGGAGSFDGAGPSDDAGLFEGTGLLGGPGSLDDAERSGGAEASVGQGPPVRGEEETWFRVHAEALAGLAERARTVEEAAEAAARRAASTWERARGEEAARERRRLAEAHLAGLESRRERAEEDRARLAAARRAAPIDTAAASLRRAESAASAARTVAEAAARAVADLDGGRALPPSFAALAGDADHLAAASAADLREVAAQLAAVSGELRTALAAETELPGLVGAVGTAETELRRSVDRRVELAERRAAAPAETARLLAVLTEHEGVAAGIEERIGAHASARDRVAAHAEVERLTVALAAARTAEAEASASALAARARHDALLRARLQQSAAVLARELAADEPCPVCGSVEHPAPAVASSDDVTDEAVDAAALAAHEALGALGAATEKAAATATALAGATASAEGTLAEARAELELASAELERARTARVEAVEARAALERHRTQVETDREAMAELDVEITRLTSEHAAAVAEVARVTSLVDAARGEAESVAALARVLGAAREATTALAAAREAEAARSREAEQRRTELTEAVAISGFDSVDEALAAALPRAELENLEVEVAEFDRALAAARGKLDEASAVAVPDEPADLAGLETASRDAAAARADAARAATLAEADRARFEALRAAYAETAAGSRATRERADVVRALAATLEGGGGNTRRIRLESFVLAARLESIVAAANRRLLAMTSGQYALEVDDGHQYRNVESGLGLRVADAHTGVSRSTASLSGGETFLASLALALGLAETVAAEAGGIQLDTLFIDEGFGALDADTLEIAMATLEDLRSGGRVVGLISHVEAMKDDIPAQLRVTRLPDRSSRVEVVAPA
ncbi:exonuclease SbcC [Salana multivorans]|uniref:Nuclease SbcCD subunit C n=1 Tax=Salana multivorans TaxID=120377 RepID=A0A3N2D8C1_9MICO|nr:SMC family ATPase [Salana multivorans]ROR96036.1 exonuclease SbcC [Salana multivorans]